MADRRVAFFLIAALVCALLTFAAPADLRWVAEATAAVYVVLAALTALERLSTRAYQRKRHREP